VNRNIVIFGNSMTAHQTAVAFQEKGFPVYMITPDDASVSAGYAGKMASDHFSINCLTHAHLNGLAGYANQFNIDLKTDDGSKILEAGGIVIAEDVVREANHAAYGLAMTPLTPGLSVILHRIGDSPVVPENWAGITTVVFLLNLSAENHPIMARETMMAAKTLRSEMGIKTYVLTGNLKVADDGLEAMYQDCRNAGVVFVKFTETRPRIDHGNGQSVEIDFVDEITGDRFFLRPDLVVVDERILAAPGLKHLARVMRLELDDGGYIQADNVHRLPVYTNRKGVFAVGGSRGVPLSESADTDIANVCTGIDGVMTGRTVTPGAKALIHSGQCIRCLTCYRVCPYAAIMLGVRPEVISDLCERCGICAAECPREAITISDYANPVIAQQIARHVSASGAMQSPFLVAFCCGRSAIPSKNLALADGHSLPSNLLIIEVPCAGSISIDYLLSAFRHQADGVLVLSCHTGNCHSEHGNRYVRQRVENLLERLAVIGVEPNRLQLTTIAANMPAEFAETVTRFEQQIIQLNQVKP